MKFGLLRLITLLLAFGFSPDAKADVCQYQEGDYQGNNKKCFLIIEMN